MLACVGDPGGLTYKRLRDAGYIERFSSALLIAAGAIDNLIPPSVGFILYGIASDTSIVKLFAAGIFPGLVLAAFYAIYIYRFAIRQGDRGERRCTRPRPAAWCARWPMASCPSACAS